MATAFLLGPRRDRVLVRVGRWCLVASWVQVMLWLVLPELLPVFASLVGARTTCLVAGLAGRYLSPVLHHRDIPPVGRRASARTVAAREQAAQEQSARDRSDGDAAQPGPYEVQAAFSDLNMLVLPGGRERSEQQYAGLLEAADLQLRRVAHTSSSMSIVEARASG